MDLNTAAVIFMGGYVLVIVVAGLVLSLRPGGGTVPLSLSGWSSAAAAGCGRAILLGGDVEAMGNFRGRVESVLVVAGTGRLDGVTVASSGGLIEGERVPAGAIESSDGRRLQIREPWSQAQPDGHGPLVTLHRGASVFSAAGRRLGKLRLVCFDSNSGLVRGLILSRGRRSNREVFLPIQHVKAAGSERVDTDLRPEQLSGLQSYATDESIKEAVVERLEGDPALRPFARSLRVEVRNQRVQLSGYVRTQAEAEKAAEAARAVPGVIAVDRGMRSDEDLASAVREAISRDLGSSGTDVEVRSVLGQVDIVGRVHDRQAVRRIETAASRVPGVLVMHNLVTVS
jgi:osmotically-inducible protein OsmY